jgi:DNA-binding GntR family transcriptional regulator
LVLRYVLSMDPLQGGLGVAAAKPGRSTQDAIETIVRDLEDDIVLGYLHPRERLVEDALIERFNAKRYTVREALSRLERLGLVERHVNRGAMVRALRPLEVEEIYSVREILETAAAREVLRLATVNDVERIVEAQRHHDRAVEQGDPKRIFRTNIVFHRTFFSTCGNAELLGAIDLFAQKAHPIRSLSIAHPEYVKRAQAEHWMIIDALRGKREKELLTICREHIRAAKDEYIETNRRWFPD